MLRVLVVDDARLVADLKATPLGREEVQIERAGPYEDVVERALTELPDVVIFADGEGCPEPRGSCRQLREDSRTESIRIVYIGSNLSRRACLDGGFDVFVPRLGTVYELGEALSLGLRLRGRAGPRWVVDLECALTFAQTRLEGRCRELSLGGCRVVASISAEIGEPVGIRFAEDRDREELIARVVRCGNVAAGRGEREITLRFAYRDARGGIKMSRRLRDLVERRAPDEVLGFEQGAGIRESAS